MSSTLSLKVSLKLLRSLKNEMRRATPRKKEILLNKMRAIVNSSNKALSKVCGVPWSPLKIAR
jgi:hypothetical protein